MGQTAKSDQPGQRGNSCQKQSQLNVMADSNLNSGSNQIPQIGNVLRQHGKAQPLRAKVSADLLPKIMEIEDMDLEENMHVEAVLEPKVGTIFNSEDEAKEYYSTYAKAKDFGSIVKASKKCDDGVKAYITYACHRSGKPKTTALNPIKSHPTSKVDCKAHMNISLQVDRKWMLNLIELNHNHELDPEKAKYLKCYRTPPPHSQRAIELSMDIGIKLTPFIRACVIGEGGPDNATWTEKDARNHKDKARCSELKEGDAEAMHKYFVRMQEDNVENELDVEDYPSNMPIVGDAQFDSESFLDNSNAVGDPSKGPRRGQLHVEVCTHAARFDEIITQESGTVTESVEYNGTWCYDLNESPFDLGHDLWM
ncbi:hypothetical protein Acr_15g0013490 [Actinidia rufa]|uniref:FAR1 domain-containing protein n=1 Tax=Actinidia rufa TaxID=165716 RepID=A0A7J0FVL5_9ERIC|nr:hypothetical protein Acr_15g0013490 [Actinidia rufa]